jgi:hypothetical protein
MARRLEFVPSSSRDDLAEQLRRDTLGARAKTRNQTFLFLRQALILAVVTSTAFGLGYGAGKLLHDPRAVALAHASGACIALEMAAAYGAIDELERRMTLHALASALNPHFERFPEQAREITSACAKLTKGAISGKVAR